MNNITKFEVITTERRKARGGEMPTAREPSRIEDLNALVEKTCASFDRVDSAAQDLNKTLQKA